MQAKTKSQDEYCRICGMVLSCNRIHIFKMDPIVRKKIFKLIPYKISKDDGLPQDCCSKCNDTLKHFVTFIDRSWYIQKSLLRTVTSVNDHESIKRASILLSREWYCDSSEDQDITKKIQCKCSEQKESRSEAHDEQDNAKNNNKESTPGNKSESIQTEERTKSIPKDSSPLSEEEKNKGFTPGNKSESIQTEERTKSIPKDSSPLSEEQENARESTPGNKSESIQTKDRTKSILKDSSQLSEESDTTTYVSSRNMDEKEKMKRKQRFRRANPFCDRKAKNQRKTNHKKRKNDVEEKTETSVATSKGSRTQRSKRFCQLVANGKVTLVKRLSMLKELKNPDFILTRIPNFGLIYTCNNCFALYTTEAAAEKHTCDKSLRTSDSNKEESSQPRYACEICNVKFHRRVTLEHHLSTHVDKFASDRSDEGSPPPQPSRSRRKARHSSESSDEISMKSRRTSSESEESSSDISESDLDTDTFVVDDDFVEYE